MSSLTRAVVRWSIVEALIVNGVGGWLSTHLGMPFALLYPASWLVFALAGGEAARRGQTWHGIAAGAAVALIENLLWHLQGAPGHADTPDLPPIVAALTYITLMFGVTVLGAVCGALGALIGRRVRARRDVGGSAEIGSD